MPTLSGLVKRRFIHCVNTHHQTIPDVLEAIGLPPADLCRIIAGQNVPYMPLTAYHCIARWLHMPLSNTIALGGKKPKLDELVKLGMEAHGYRTTSAQDQITAALEVGVSVAVFRRALHGYGDFTPSLRTCEQFANWLAWTGLSVDDLVLAAGMIVRYRPDGTRVAITPHTDRAIKPYPCACNRPGCTIPAHIPSGPRRKWRSDACRMWAKRQAERSIQPHKSSPHPAPIVRFITINERSVPVRF